MIQYVRMVLCIRLLEMYRNKVVIVELLDYFDCDTEKEIEEKIEKYSKFSEIIYIAFTEKFEHIIVKLKKC